MQTTLFPETAPVMPEGFRYQPNLISREQERELIDEILRLPLKPFEFHGYFGNRRVKAFGYRYDYTGVGPSPPTKCPTF